MPRSPIARLRGALRSPWTITLELAGIALAGVAATVVEQHPPAAERARLAAASPTVAAVHRALGLDHIFTAGWFLAVVGLSACSLAIVVREQWRRVAREWGPRGEASFASAPFRRELLRAPTGEGRRVRITTRGRVATLGSPLFHTGLLAVAVSGVLHMLLAASAGCDAMEGEVLEAGSGSFEAHDVGLLGAPVSLPRPVSVKRLEPSYYPSGELQGLSAQVRLLGPDARHAVLTVNEPLELGTARLHITQAFGPVALVEIGYLGTTTRRAAVLAEGESRGFEWRGTLPGPLELRLRAPPESGGPRPRDEVEVRALSGGKVLAAGRLHSGGALPLPDGGYLALREVRWWVRLLASRDPSAWPVYAGFATAIAGLLLALVFVRVDVLTVAERLGGEERVVVAMRPGRLAPLFTEEFERLVERASRGG